MSMFKGLFKKETRSVETSKAKQPGDARAYELSQSLAEHFSTEELRELCFALGIHFEDLPGEARLAKARELVSYFMRPPHTLDELIAACSRLRPGIPWEQPGTIVTRPVDPNRLALVQNIINYCFDANELCDLFLELGADYDALARGNKAATVNELVMYFSRLPRTVDQLVTVGMALRPKAPWNDTIITKYEPYSHKALVQFRSLLVEYFDEDEVRQLSADLGVDHRRLPWSEQGGTARELILYLARRERLDELAQWCAQKHPEVVWQEVLQKIDEAQPSEKVNSQWLKQQLLTFSDEQLRDLCFELGVDADDLAQRHKIMELIMHFERRGRIQELAEACTHYAP